MPACPRRLLAPAALLLAMGAACRPAAAAGPEPPPRGTARTGKERMADKAADEQRVNDCKVPPERRTRPRPTACPAPAGR